MSENEVPEKKKRKFPWRWMAILLLFVGLWLIGKLTGLNDKFSVEWIRESVDKSGIWGALVFIAIFSLGELVHIPGMVFVAAGILAFGPVMGFFLGVIAALCSVCFSFVVVRAVGGKAIAEIKRPFIQKILARLDKRPITTVIVLRLILWLAPPLNYALALSNIKFRDYAIGSGLGLVLPVLVFSTAFDWIYTRFFT